MDSIQPILSMQNIVKRFGGNTAVNHVSLDVMPGEVVALLGENGAGKSTLIKILAGVYQRDAGDIVFGEKKIESARTLQKSGEYPIAFIHQDLGLVDWMTVAENMAFVMGFPRKLGFIDWGKVRQNSQKALQGIGIDIDPDTRVFELSRTEKSLLAIARAVAVDAEVLVLDEPTASLPADDVRHLFRVINKLRQRNVGMIYVTHRLDEVMDIADRVCVMRDGHYIAGGVTDQYDIGDLVKLIVGEEKKGDKRRPRPTGQPSTLSINELSVGDTGPVSFQYSLAINDLYFDFMAASLKTAKAGGTGAPYNISAGDGSVSAYQRIRAGNSQTATVPEPLKLHGWQLLDEINRAVSGEAPSGYVTPVHLVTKDNIEFDGGPSNVYDPQNDYQGAYKKIWGVN